MDVSLTQVVPMQYSHSKLGAFESCAFKAYRVYVKKDIPWYENPNNNFHVESHAAMEAFAKDPKNTQLDPALRAKLEPYAQVLENFTGLIIPEQKIAINKALKPCDYFDSDVLWRGAMDVLLLSPNNTAEIWDYKFGKVYADDKQMIAMAWLAFTLSPKLQTITTRLIYAMHDEEIAKQYTRAQYDELTAAVVHRMVRTQKILQSGLYPKTPSGLCRKHCDVPCEHNGRTDHNVMKTKDEKASGVKRFGQLLI